MNNFDTLVVKVLESKKKPLPTKILTKGWLAKSGGPMTSRKQKAKERDTRKGRKNYKGDYE